MRLNFLVGGFLGGIVGVAFIAGLAIATFNAELDRRSGLAQIDRALSETEWAWFDNEFS